MPEPVPSGTPAADVGVTGLAVMGRNLARNLARHGYRVAVHNRTQARTEELLGQFGGEGDFVRTESLADLVASLSVPRRVVVMVEAGKPVDAVLDQLAPLLEPGDIVLDGGNAHFDDTCRRAAALDARGIRYLGTGISGGAQGALHGPSIMVGGDSAAYLAVEEMLTTVAARAGGEPCCAHVGPDGAGHFVKMVHNGIEYAALQLIGEAYDLLRTVGGLAPGEVAGAFEAWDAAELEGYLLATAVRALRQADPDDGRPLVDVVSDHAEQKGTGRWTIQAALELGVPAGLMAEGVFTRSLSGETARRAAMRSAAPSRPTRADPGDDLVADVRAALHAALLVAYAQGFDTLRAAGDRYEWSLDLAAVARVWRGGCIIRAGFLRDIAALYAEQPRLPALLAGSAMRRSLDAADGRWRRTVCTAVTAGRPVPGLSSALAYVDGLRAERLPTALVQLERDLFGSHTYRRVDRPGTYHVDWDGDGREHRQDQA